MKKSYFFKTIMLLTFVLFWAGNGLMAQNENYLEFDGTNDYVYRADNSDLDKLNSATEYTIEAWIYVGTWTNNKYIANRYSHWGFYLRESGQLAFKVSGGNTNWSTDNAVSENSWHHVAVIRKSGRLYFYVNGDDVTSGTHSGSTLPSASTNDNLYIGRYYGTSSSYFSGYIDEFRCTAAGLSIEDLNYHTYDNQYEDNPTTTAALFHFNEGTGTTTVDAAKNISANLYGTPTWRTWDYVSANHLPLAYEWTGGGGTADWATATNWDPGVAPTLTNDVIIPNVTNDDPLLGTSTSTTCNNLDIESGGSLSIEGSLTVSGTLTNNAGNTGLVIKSTATEQGSLIHSTVGVSGTVERYIAAATWATWNDGWHFLSSTVADYPIQDNFTVATAADYDFYAWSEPDNEWINFKTSDSPSFETVNGSTDFELGNGYMAAYKDAGTKYFTGTLNVGDINVTGLNITGTTASNRSWHLLGNPFCSALTWYTDWTITTVSGTAKIWKEENQSYSTLSGGDPIPATNGFMVQATATGSSLTIPASKRLHSTQAFYKNVGYPIVKLKANNIDYPSAQESELRFNPESTLDWDMEFDSDFLSGYAPLFYSKIDDMPMAVNSMPDYNENTIIPFTFVKNEGLNFSIELYEIANMDTDVWLLDKKLNKQHNLSVDPVYVFTSFEGENINRFDIYFSPLGLEEQFPTENRIQIWTSNNTVNILNHNQGTGTIAISNIIGQIVYIQQLNGTSHQVLNTNLNTGIYIVSLKLKSGYVISKKVIIK